jgi:quercetin dioxygenase-like cupin family protein
MRRILLLVATGLVAMPVMAQDPVGADPKHVKVEFENAQVRVLRITVGPHEKVPVHDHPQSVTVWLTDAHTRSTPPDGKVQERNLKAGQVVWVTASTHTDENLRNELLELISVEIKPQQGVSRSWGFHEPAKAEPAKSAPVPPAPASPPAQQNPAQPPPK